MARRKGSYDSPSYESRPAATPEEQEQLMISLAYKLAEKRLREGTATSQEVTHFLKLGSERARAELEIIELQKELTKAKTEKIRSEQIQEELYANAIAAFQHYSGALRRDDGQNV